MQDALPAFVLNSETLPRKSMSEAADNLPVPFAQGGASTAKLERRAAHACFHARLFGGLHGTLPPLQAASLWVRRAVEKLDSLDREIVMLREFEQLSYAEIADLLQLPLNTVRSRLFRARTALRELLDPSTVPTSAGQKVTPANTPQNAANPETPRGYRL